MTRQRARPLHLDRRLGLPRLALTLLFGALWALPGSLLGAPAKILGPSKCTSCHEHEKQAAWAGKDTHAKALQQLEDKKAAGYAKAIGLGDPYDLKGSCVGCHATVFNGDANAGVSCETCHAPGSDYIQPHQEKGAYAKAVALGMFDTRGNLPVWAKMCVDCHVMKDAKLIAAGHKSGADFDVGVSSQKIVHWAQTYDWAKLSAAGKAAAGSRAGGAAPKAEAPKPPPPAAAPAPTQPPAKPVAAPAEARPTAKPAPEARPTAKPAAEAKPAPPAATTAPAFVAPTATVAPAAPRPAATAARASIAPSPEVAIVIESTPIPPRPPTRTPAPPQGETAPAVAAPSAPPGEPAAVAGPRPPAPKPPAPPAKKPVRRRAAPRPSGPTAPPSPAPSRTPTKRPAPVLPQHAPN